VLVPKLSVTVAGYQFEIGVGDRVRKRQAYPAEETAAYAADVGALMYAADACFRSIPLCRGGVHERERNRSAAAA